MQTQRQGAIGVLRPRGVLNADVLELAETNIGQLKLTGRMMLVLDLTDTVVIDSAALEWMLDLDERCGSLGGGLNLANPNDLCHEILSITGMTHQLGVYRDLASAMGSFAQ